MVDEEKIVMIKIDNKQMKRIKFKSPTDLLNMSSKSAKIRICIHLS
jgi:hypothetical protein